MDIDDRNDEFLSNLFKWENPDFIAVTGDIVSGIYTYIY